MIIVSSNLSALIAGRVEENSWVKEQKLTAWEGPRLVALMPVWGQGREHMGQSLGPLPAPEPLPGQRGD